jgi:hypothetical protein
MFFPTLLWSIDLAWFRSNQQLLFVIGLALLILSAIVLLVATWQDETIGTTAKLVATLVVVVANFFDDQSSYHSHRAVQLHMFARSRWGACRLLYSGTDLRRNATLLDANGFGSDVGIDRVI